MLELSSQTSATASQTPPGERRPLALRYPRGFILALDRPVDQISKDMLRYNPNPLSFWQTTDLRVGQQDERQQTEVVQSQAEPGSTTRLPLETVVREPSRHRLRRRHRRRDGPMRSPSAQINNFNRLPQPRLAVLEPAILDRGTHFTHRTTLQTQNGVRGEHTRFRIGLVRRTNLVTEPL